jgi:hypothetical protein
MTLRAVLPPLLVSLVVASAAPLWGANERERQRPVLARGGLHLVASKRGAILSGRNLAPGDRVTGAVTIANRGALPGSFTLDAKVRGSRSMAGNLALTVRERRRRGLRVVYSGTLARFRGVKLGTIRRGQARRFRFTVAFRTSAPNALQGRRATASFTWRAVQRS